MSFKVKLKVGNKEGVKRELQKILDEAGFIGSNIKKMPKGKEGVGMGGFVGAMMKGLAGFTGVIGAIGLIAQQFGGLTSMVSSIVRLLIEFLRPIADVVMLLLMPVLAIIRPILQVVRTIMAPFRKAALQLSREGAQNIASGNVTEGLAQIFAGTSVILEGLQMAISLFLEKAIIGAVSATGSLLSIVVAKVLEFFGVPFEETIAWFSEKTKLITDMIEVGFATGAILIAAQTTTMINAVGGNASDFVDEITPIISDMFLSDTNSLKSAWVESMLGWLETVDEKTSILSETFSTGMDGFSLDAMTAIKDNFVEISSEFGQRIVKFSNYAKTIIQEQLSNQETTTENSGSGNMLTNILENIMSLPTGGIPVIGPAVEITKSLTNTDFFSGLIESTKKFFGAGEEKGEMNVTWESGLDSLNKQNKTFMTGMNKTYTDALGKDGTVINTVDMGIGTLTKSADGFDKAMNKAADGVVNAVNKALSAASKAVDNAEKYARLIRQLSASRSDT